MKEVTAEWAYRQYLALLSQPTVPGCPADTNTAQVAVHVLAQDSARNKTIFSRAMFEAELRDLLVDCGVAP